MKRRRALAVLPLLALAGCGHAPPVPVEPDWEVGSVHDLVVEFVDRTMIRILWTEEMRLREKFSAFPRSGPLWDRPDALLSALRQVLRAHDLNLVPTTTGGIYKIVPATRC